MDLQRSSTTHPSEGTAVDFQTNDGEGKTGTFETSDIFSPKDETTTYEERNSFEGADYLVSSSEKEETITPRSVTVDSQRNSTRISSKLESNDNNIIISVLKSDGFYQINYQNGNEGRLFILDRNIFRLYIDPTGEFKDDPEPRDIDRPAIIVQKQFNTATMSHNALFESSDCDGNTIHFADFDVEFDKKQGTFKVYDKKKTIIFEELEPIKVIGNTAVQTLKQNKDEYFFGGGTQNGRFSHKGEDIKIVNSNIWVDGGVASPNPFYWSTRGYGVLRNTFQEGSYSFKDPGKAVISHRDNKFDSFYIVDGDKNYYNIIKKYHNLTGQPILMPLFGFYEAHLNAYNRDYWQEVSRGTNGAIQFEDGKFYLEKQPQHAEGKGIRETLNGEKSETYQFSARKVIDRYKENDMPLGWFLPNDGYGSGYGQTDSLEGNIKNLALFGEYARENGVELGLWTQQDLNPKDPKNPKPDDRDISREVKEAGVKAIKTDVAWVGKGYSFGLNATDEVSSVIVKESSGNIRPFIVSLDGWAGTQRSAGVWTGDQVGGKWEYIRFHIPTYIGTGLSGNPNIGSDMDGIFGGGNKEVNIRDFQWKTFTPIQMNMDGWGYHPKTPFAFDKEATDINRAYLKLKSQLIPYIYSIAHTATFDGKPMVRAMFLEFPDETGIYSDATKYQYMFGDFLLIAPVYNDEKNKEGMPTRSGIFLPDENIVWYDMLSGDAYKGGKTYNNVKVPLWKLPVFVKEGAILPLVNPNNNPNEINRSNMIVNYWPSVRKTKFILSEDDGYSINYLNNKIAKAVITAQKIENTVQLNISKFFGDYKDFNPNRSIELNIRSSSIPRSVTVNGEKLRRASSKSEFESNTNVFFLDDMYNISSYLKDYAGQALNQSFLRIKLDKRDLAKFDTSVVIEGVAGENLPRAILNPRLRHPTNIVVVPEKTSDQSLTFMWDKDNDFENYEIEFSGRLLDSLGENFIKLDSLKPNSRYEIRVRKVVNNEFSEWSNFVSGTTLKDDFIGALEITEFKSNYPDHPGQELQKLFNKNSSKDNVYHTAWGSDGRFTVDKPYLLLVGVPHDVENISKIVYIPRDDAGNGTILDGTVKLMNYDEAKGGWYVEPDSEIRFNWTRDSKNKVINISELLGNKSKARYLLFEITNAVGNFVSGRQLLVYGANPSHVDETFLINYIGTEKDKDNDYEYVSIVDANQDGLIDVYDMYNVFNSKKMDSLMSSGMILLDSNVINNDEVDVAIYAKDFNNVSAYGITLRIDEENFIVYDKSLRSGKFSTKMENYSKIKKHSNGEKGLYIVQTYRNSDQQLSGSGILNTFRIRLLSDNLSKNEINQMLINAIDVVRMISPSGNDRKLKITSKILTDTRSDTDKYNPEDQKVTTELNKEPDASEGIKNKKDLPKDAKYTWKEKVDVNTAGNKKGTVVVTYPDGSSDEVEVDVTVTDTRSDADKYEPTVEGEKVEIGGTVDLTDNVTNLPTLPDGSQYHGTADKNGNFTVNVPKLEAGTKVRVTTTDESGNTSEPINVVVSSNKKDSGKTGSKDNKTDNQGNNQNKNRGKSRPQKQASKTYPKTGESDSSIFTINGGLILLGTLGVLGYKNRKKENE